MQETQEMGLICSCAAYCAGRCTVALGRDQVIMTQLSMPAEQAPTVIFGLIFKNALLLDS